MSSSLEQCHGEKRSDEIQIGFSIVQYACAVLLIVTSILMVSYQVITIADVANGLLMYVAQAFLLAGSIFGLDYYVKKIKEEGLRTPSA